MMEKITKLVEDLKAAQHSLARVKAARAAMDVNGNSPVWFNYHQPGAHRNDNARLEMPRSAFILYLDQQEVRLKVEVDRMETKVRLLEEFLNTEMPGG